jgi:lipopolysaccharide/colanic/teichoic acid biosynthesis glycosyltransferase
VTAFFVRKAESLTGVMVQALDCLAMCLGRFLPKTSLDKQPQFFNVMQGQMSVAGMRPTALEHCREWMDLKIIFLTPLATIQNKNVY